MANLWAIIWQAIVNSRMNMMTIERGLKGEVNDEKLLLVGVVASEIGWLGRESLGKYEAARSRHDGFFSGARNAMEKSVEHLGELGVTMMAGSGDSKGNVRSRGAGTRV
jgi:hypothetical protein